MKAGGRRMILHTLHIVQNDGVERVVIHANDTDITNMCPHYGAIHQRNLPELLVKKAQNTYLPML